MKKYSYKELGLENTREMFKREMKVDTQYLLSTFVIWNNYKLF